MSSSFNVAVIGISHLNVLIGPNQSCHVFIVVVFSSGYVFLVTHQRLFLTPVFVGLISSALDTISMQQEDDFPDPTGPLIALTKSLYL